MSKALRSRAAAALAAATMFAGSAWAQAEVVTVPGGTVTHTIPGTATPPIGPLDVATPPITVPRTCAGTVFCAGPVYIPPQTVVHVPRVNPIPVTPPITVTVSTTDIVAVVDPALTTLITIPPTTIPVPNPFGGDPIPVDVCPSSCTVPGASVVDGATGSVTVSACVGATCETQVVPVQVGDTSPGQVCFTQATMSVAEGTGANSTATLFVQRIGGSFNDASVNWGTQNGTALAPADYLSAGGRLYWGHGESGAKSVSVTIIGDSTNETEENFSVVLSGAVGATLCQPSVASVTIVDDDNPPSGSIHFATDVYSLSEAGGSFTVEVVRDGGSFGTLTATVNLNDGSAMAPADYVDQTTALTWPDGDSSSRFVTVVVNNDAADEADETLTATLSGSDIGTPSTATLTIIDDDEPVVIDDDPDQFVFVDRFAVARSTYIYSNIVTITGINTAASITASGGQFSIRTNGICDGTGTWQTSGTVTNGQMVCVRHMSSADFSTSVSTTLTVGAPGVSDTFTSTTRDEPLGCNPPPGQICP